MKDSCGNSCQQKYKNVAEYRALCLVLNLLSLWEPRDGCVTQNCRASFRLAVQRFRTGRDTGERDGERKKFECEIKRRVETSFMLVKALGKLGNRAYHGTSDLRVAENPPALAPQFSEAKSARNGGPKTGKRSFNGKFAGGCRNRFPTSHNGGIDNLLFLKALLPSSYVKCCKIYLDHSLLVVFLTFFPRQR